MQYVVGRMLGGSTGFTGSVGTLVEFFPREPFGESVEFLPREPIGARDGRPLRFDGTIDIDGLDAEGKEVGCLASGQRRPGAGCKLACVLDRVKRSRKLV
jgi:hypothetical protein